MKIEPNNNQIIIQFHQGPLDDRKIFIKKVKEFATTHGYDYLLLDTWPENISSYKPDIDDPVVLSEYLRFQLPIYFHNMIWVDTDAELKSLWEMKKGKPYFNFRENGGMDYSLFSSNNCPNWFERLIQEFKKRKIQPGYMCWAKILRDKESQVNKIDSKYYSHRYFTFNKWNESRKRHKKSSPG